MSGISATQLVFPTFKSSLRALWAPLMFEPIAGAYDRLIVGVAAVSGDQYHLELANALDRLKCLYRDDAGGILQAIEMNAEYLRHDLKVRGLNAIQRPNFLTSGFSMLDCREAEGESLKQIGANWMRTLSSLYYEEPSEMVVYRREGLMELVAYQDHSGDRLPALILQYVARKRDGLKSAFSPSLRAGRTRRLAGHSHEVVIDFTGSKLVANFGTVQANKLAGSVNLIKRRLWDLKVQRDSGGQIDSHLQHEMIIQVPQRDDPQVSERRFENISLAVEDLTDQADKVELRLLSKSTVEEIGEHVLRREAA